MIAEKIEGCVTELRTFAGQVSEEQWARIKCVIAELADAAESVAALGAALIVPHSLIGAEPTKEEILQVVHKMRDAAKEGAEVTNG